jgi:uncharacterized protein YicC (UPF0701 family)
MDMRTKTRQINFRVSEKDYTSINKKCAASGMNMSNYILHCALKKEIVILEGFRDFYTELHRIGVNLNQITKLFSEGTISCASLDEMKEEVNRVWQSINSLTQKVV